MAFVTVYRKDSGEKMIVPEAHLRIFPDAFSKTPRRKVVETPSKPATPPAGAATKEKN